jgi:hypothetical protein
LWRPGDTFRETYWVPVADDAPAPCLGQLGVTFFAPEQWTYLDVLDGAGRSAGRSAVFGRLKIRPAARVQYDTAEPVRFILGAQAALVGVDARQTQGRGALSLTLLWQARARMDRDYTVFVHLVDREGRILAQWDAQPRGGTYPTSLWENGEIVKDEHELMLPAHLPAGEYQLTVGMYLLETMQRLPTFDAQGRRLPQDQITRVVRLGPSP